MNVKRNGLQHLISPFSHCERDLGVFMEKSRGCCDEHYPVIMKGMLLYCQSPQTSGRLGTTSHVHSCVHAPLYLYLEGRIN